MKKRINEGGNIFKNADGQPDTIRINRVDVEPTVQWLETITGLELTDYKLGTTGLAPSSGDIDLAVDQEKINKEQLVAKLSGWLRSKNMDPAEYIKKSGVSVHFKTPIQGNPKNGNVQTDFMFGDPEWMKFSLSGTVGSAFKGSDRHVMLASIAKPQGYKWSFKSGLIDRETNEVITKEPDKIAELLLGKGATGKDLSNVETIHAKIKNRTDYNELIADAKDSFMKIGKELPEHIITGTPVWFRNLMDRIPE
tara:strand:- start:1010 stop:1765 length:756 start_codon:yes stop_codon:yes gene_type:complete